MLRKARMDQITRLMRNGWQTFKIYTEAEAREENFVIVPWREAKVGDWALSDDGYVGKCIRVFEPAKCRLVVLTYGLGWTHAKKPMLYEERRAIKNWSSTSNWAEQEARKTRSKNVVAAYVAMLVSDSKVDWDVLGRMYRPDYKRPLFGLKRDFKTKAFRKMIQQELERVLLEQGSSPKRTIAMYNDAFDVAVDKSQAGNMITVADRFSDLWRLKESIPNGELPPGLGDVTILEGVSEDLQIARQRNGK